MDEINANLLWIRYYYLIKKQRESRIPDKLFQSFFLFENKYFYKKKRSGYYSPRFHAHREIDREEETLCAWAPVG